MTTTLNFKDIIDLPEWRPLAVTPNAHTAGGAIAGDLRNSAARDPKVFQLVSSTVLNDYNVKNDGWSLTISPALAGTAALGAGSGCVFAPHRGPRGTLASGTSTSVTLTTALPAAVGINQLANRCDGTGFKIRIIGNRSGGAGVTEERTIIGNTAGTTPTIYLDSALSFTPGSGDGYEILSGRLYCLGMGTTAAGIWKAYDRATNSMLANLSTTNLPATIGTDASFVMLDEQYCINLPGEGFLLGTGDGGIAAHALTATGSSSTTLTGQTSGGDYAINANEYRNFQIRIVKDVSIPTAVGQRRKITSHTGGAATTPVYTVPTWTVTPSVNAQYVIENANECLLWSTASTNTYCYVSDAVGSASADTWSTSTYGVRSGAMAAGCVSFQPFATALDAQKNARYSFIYSWRGGGVTTMDVLDIAGGSTGAWSGAAVYGGSSVLLNTGNSGVYDPFSGYYYMNPVGTNAFSRFQPTHRVMENWAQLRFAQGTAVVGNRMASHAFIDGSTKVPFVFVLAGARTELFHCLISR